MDCPIFERKNFFTVGASLLPIFVSKIEKKGLAILCACVIIIISVLNAIEQYKTQIMNKEMREYAYDNLYDDTNRIVMLLSQMIFYATDEWSPTNQEEFFSQRTANIICGELILIQRHL